MSASKKTTIGLFWGRAFFLVCFGTHSDQEKFDGFLRLLHFFNGDTAAFLPLMGRDGAMG